jgi:hypothetical protein
MTQIDMVSFNEDQEFEAKFIGGPLDGEERTVVMRGEFAVVPVAYQAPGVEGYLPGLHWYKRTVYEPNVLRYERFEKVPVKN